MSQDDLDTKLDELLRTAGDTYRVPPEPPLEAMWQAIDAELPARRPVLHTSARPGARWGAVGIAAAAALVIGIGLGRWTAVVPSPAVAAGEAPPADVQQVAYITEPLQRAAANYLGETAGLLRDLQSESNGTYSAQATTLLVTTRLLLDSPAATDARLRDLLEDLELVLVQIAALRTEGTGARRHEELQLIRSALAEREVVPRLRTAVVSLASYER